MTAAELIAAVDRLPADARMIVANYYAGLGYVASRIRNRSSTRTQGQWSMPLTKARFHSMKARSGVTERQSQSVADWHFLLDLLGTPLPDNLADHNAFAALA